MPIGRLFGIPIKIHVTLIALIAVLFLLAPAPGAGVRGIFAIVLLFGSVLLHELGHALVARRYGVRTREIVLLPIGGAALLVEHPREPMHELWIALAGPAVSLLLAGLGFLGGLITPLVALADLVFINLAIGLFNLLPAFPLDGGRALRALLARWMGNPRATRVAARIGRLIALGLFAVAVAYGQLVLGFIAVFVFVAAMSEERSVVIQQIVGQKRVADMMQATLGLSVQTPVREAAHLLRDRPYLKALPVAYGDRVVGVVHQGDLRGDGPAADERPVSVIADRNVVTRDEQASLMELLHDMGAARSRAAVVMAGGEVRGVVTVEHVLEEIRAARHAEF